MTPNEIFEKMFSYLSENNLVANQADMARLTGVSEVGISRILNGRVKRAKQSTLRQVNAAFGNIFNPAFLRGKSNIMLAADAQKQISSVPRPVSGDTIAAVSTTPPDYSSLINAAIAAKDETIMSLKHELTAKDETIATKDTLIKAIQQQVEDLRMQVADLRMQAASQKGVYGGVPQWGVAESDVRTGATR